MNDFLTRVEELRILKRVSRSKMLNDLGLNQNSFVNWTNRDCVPSGDIVVRIANYLGVTSDYLLTGYDPSGGMQFNVMSPDISEKIIKNITEKVLERVESEMTIKKESEKPKQNAVRAQIDSLIDKMSDEKQRSLLTLLKTTDND